jgi:MFS family permease
MSRRLAAYNMVWSSAGAIAVATNGALIDHWLSGVLWLPAILHAVSALLLFIPIHEREAPPNPPIHLHAEEALIAKRTLALWLSRLALPSTYVVIYSLMAMLPSMPVIQRMSPTQGTLISSVWLAARFLAFALLAATVWWHSRPQLLLVASIAMLIAFLGAILPAAEKLPWPSSNDANHEWLIVSQIVLGLAMGIIYSASLYFGMVLSEGSTEHGGYHEALIGAGQVVGPGLGALASAIFPNQSLATITAVAGILAASVIACAIATLVQRSRA